ncbi:MAG: hypothetical protein Q8K60_03105 [Parachlamydiaceae bacterium]|nr:hypothetical protein [Parachlamydiaceae bacterium]
MVHKKQLKAYDQAYVHYQLNHLLQSFSNHKQQKNRHLQQA